MLPQMLPQAKYWWFGEGSKSAQTVAVVGSPGQTRTADRVVNSHLLYQLSYRGSERGQMLLRKHDWVKKQGNPSIQDPLS